MKKNIVNTLMALFGLFVLYKLVERFFWIPYYPCPKESVGCVSSFGAFIPSLVWLLNFLFSVAYIFFYFVIQYLSYKRKNKKTAMIVLVIISLFYLLNFVVTFFLENTWVSNM